MMLESRHKETLNHRENVAYKNSKVDDNFHSEYLKESNLRFKKFKESLARKIKEKTCTHNSINDSIEHKNKRHNLLKSQRKYRSPYFKNKGFFINR